MNYRMVAFVLGRIFAIEAGLMLFPLICAMLYGEWYLLPAFLLPAALLAVLGFITSRKTPKNTTIFARDGLAIVALVWVLMSAFGAVLAQLLPLGGRHGRAGLCHGRAAHDRRPRHAPDARRDPRPDGGQDFQQIER